MVRDEVLRPLGGPGEVTDAELDAFAERERDRQPRGVAECPEPLRQRARLLLRRTLRPNRLRLRKIETEQLAPIVGHENILTAVEAFIRVRVELSPPGRATLARDALERMHIIRGSVARLPPQSHPCNCPRWGIRE